MIRANEARDIAKQSDVAIERHLKLIEPKIREAAELGKTSLELYLPETFITVPAKAFQPLKPTPLMLKLREVLKQHGFGAEFILSQPKEHSGFGMIDDGFKQEPEQYQNYYITIKW